MFALDPDEIRGVVADGGAAAVASGGAVGNTSSTPNTGAPGNPRGVGKICHGQGGGAGGGERKRRQHFYTCQDYCISEAKRLFGFSLPREDPELGPRTARQPHRQPPHLQKTVAGGPHNATLSACLPCAVEPALLE